jgi:hypothetical protein
MARFFESTPSPGRSRLRSRTLIVTILALTMLATTAFLPASATGGGDDLEGVRSTVIETYNYKIDLLAGLKAETSNTERQAVYQAGIDELASIRDTGVATSMDIDELWALKETAHAIYHATVDEANGVPDNPEEALAEAKAKARNKVAYKIGLLESWIEGCDDPEARAIVAAGISQLEGLYPQIDAATTPDEAYALKARAHDIYNETIARAEATKDDDGKDDEEDRAATELANTRRATLSLIERRAALLKSAGAAARIPAVVEIYRTGAEEIVGFTDAAKSAKTVRQLKDLQGEVEAFYESVKSRASEVREGVDTSLEETLESYLDHVVDYVTSTTGAAAATADESPETFEALVAAKRTVLDRVEAVRDVTDTGSRLDARWEALDDALTDFRRALVLHYIELGEPMVVASIQIPG